MAEILILTLVFRPDNVSTAQIMADLAEDLQCRGHSVSVLTSTPHYNRDPEAALAQPLSWKWFGLIQESRYKGMRVLHAWMPEKGRNKLYRALTWAGFHLTSTIAGAFLTRRPCLILCPSPPPTIALSAWLLGLWHRAPFLYVVQEVYPDVAINLGMLKNRLLIRACYALEQFIYKRAAGISVISPRMQTCLQRKGVPEDKLAMIPNFVDVADFKPLEKDNEFARQHGLRGKFLVCYAGNMGKPQHLETLVHAAARLRDRVEVHFLLMGDGSEAGALRNLAQSFQLTNLTFLSYQPYSVMPQAYAAADVSFVPQAIGTSADGIPSKIYRIMAAGRPVIAVTDQDSDLAEMVSEAKCGYVITSHDPETLAQAITAAASDPDAWRQLGANGRRHVLQHYERSSIAEQYNTLIGRLAAHH